MPAKWQTIRVFISSTFRDMHAERDHLVKVAFPVLRERLEKYRVHLVDIDLRWGITEQQSDNDEVLDLCLDQIDDCRPFFVGLLGERYGWLPNALPAPQSKHGWTQLHTGKSVTELEILRGVLLNENMREHGLFFFRDRAFSDDVPQAKRAEVQAQSPEAADKLKQLKQRIRDAGLPIPIVENYPCRYAGLRINWRLANIDIDQADRHALEKVAADGLVDNTEYAELDERLKTIVHKYSVVYLTELEEFGHLVLDRLWDAIRDELKHKETTSDEAQFDPLEVELGYHERFMESRLRVYVGRELLQRELVKFADRDGKKPALVAGPSGSGKSAALAKFVDTYSNAHPETLVIPHFIGASAASTGLRQTLHRFCSVLKTEFGFACGIPPDIDSLITTFRLFLGQVPAERRVVLVIDGLNQLDEGDNAQQLHWLPRQLPPHVKLVTSCIRGSTRGELVLKAFRHRPHHRIDIPPLTHSEQREIVTEVPSLSAKTLDDQQIGLLLSNPATENPLYLLVALEELRGFGSYEQLRHRMARMPRLPEHQPQWESWLTQARAAAQSIDDEQRKGDELQTLGQIETTFRQTEPVEDPLTEIFLQVIERLEDEFDPKIVRAVLSLLASARRGLSDRELLDLVEHKGVAVDDSTSDLFPILRQLRFYLQHRGELRDFFHRNLYKAAKKHLLSDDAVRRANHERLAAYFFGLLNPSDAEPWSGDSPRALSELPHHQIEGALWSDLASTLCDLRFVAANCTAGMIFDLVNVYSVALNSLPELRKEREKKLQHQRRLRQYGADLTTCAREFRVSGQRARGRTTFGLRALVRRLASRARTTRDVITLPTPPDSRQTHESMRQTEAASAATNSAHFDITRVSRIQSFAAFVSTHIPQLNRFPNHTIAIGFNHASAGPVADQAGHLLESSRTAFLRRDFRPSAPPLTHLCVRTLEGHRGSSPVRAVAITPDGDTAVSVSGTTLAVWDVASGKLLRTLEATKSIDAVALTPDGTTAVSAGRDRALRVWEVASGELLRTLGRDINSVTALAITADGGKAALAN